MVKVTQVLKDLGITKTELGKHYQTVAKKKLAPNLKEISDELFSEIKALVEKNDDASSKVLKMDEFDTDGNGFLSGMGFEEEKEESIEKEKEDIFEFQTKNVTVQVLEKKESNPSDMKYKKKETKNETIDGFKEIDYYKNQFKQAKEKPVEVQKPQIAPTEKPVEDSKPKVEEELPTKKPFSRIPPSLSRGQSNSGFSRTSTSNKLTSGNKSFSSNKSHQNTKFKTENRPRPTFAPVIKKEYSPKSSDTLVKKTDIILGDMVTVKEFSEKMGIPLPEVMKKLLMNKIIVSANANIDFETASLIAEEFGIKVSKSSVSVSIEDSLNSNLTSILAQDKASEDLTVRPPIVTIMGHVDHGKTKLLDYIRKTNIVAGEAGGITQSIGASQIIHDGKKITFIDTPGHELFTQLRARGSRITDIAIIVIAADDGVKKQTVEAINHAKDAGVPIIVAITKIDKPNINPDLIKSQIAEHGLVPEEWGGDVPMVKLSAVSGQGVDELLEMINLQSEILELKYNDKRPGVGVVLEAHKDIKKGVTTSMVLMTGSLKIGDIVVVHNTYGKVRKMVDWKGSDIKVAHGGDPVLILGIQEVPEPGRVAEVVKSEKDASIKVGMINDKEKQMSGQSAIQSVMDKISKGEKALLKLILKADSRGSHEALKYAISKVELPENIDIKIIHSDIGAITDSDLALANASGAFLIGFNISINAGLQKKAEGMQVIVKCFDIIYEIMEYVDNLAKGLIKIELKEVVKGKLQVLGMFFRKANDMIIGGKVIEGKAMNGVSFKLYRGSEILGTGKVTSLKKETENVDEINVGYECGLKVKFGKKIEIDDVLEFFVLE